MVELTKNYSYKLKNEIYLELTTCDIFWYSSLMQFSLIALYIIRLLLLTETSEEMKKIVEIIIATGNPFFLSYVFHMFNDFHWIWLLVYFP